MKTCEQLNEWIIRYNDGSLQGKSLEEFKKILEEDPEVWQETLLDKELNEFLADRELFEFRETVHEVMNSRKRRTGYSCLLVAAMILLFLAFGGWISHYLSLRDLYPSEDKMIILDREEDAGSTNPVPGIFRESAEYPYHPGEQRDRNRELLAVNYSPLPFMEELVGEMFRFPSFSLVKPGFTVKTASGENIEFAWKCNDSCRVMFQVIDNSENIILTTEPDEPGKLTLDLSGREPGLYYWKLISDDGILCIGKLILGKK